MASFLNGGLFTSESVCAGHPDKVCDRISDAVVDAVLADDPNGRVAVETMVTTDLVCMAGEITTTATIDPQAIIKKTIQELGYTELGMGFDASARTVIALHTQSPEIAAGVNDDGAGDQGIMYGFAIDETPERMPMALVLSHRLAEAIDTARETKTLPYLRPDGKTQVTLRYQNGKPVAVETVVIAVPHSEAIDLSEVKADICTQIVTPVLERYGFAVTNDQVIVNGTGVWHHGGPAADTGLTGRKIVVDTYGGYARVGGGALSGKDPTKVDRSGAYFARFVANNIVALGLAKVVEVRLAFVIGGQTPLMTEWEAFGTQSVKDLVIDEVVHQLLRQTVREMIETLDLRRPIYVPTSAYGHFGRPEFPWERIV